jgi:hypothetical protein
MYHQKEISKQKFEKPDPYQNVTPIGEIVPSYQQLHSLSKENSEPRTDEGTPWKKDRQQQDTGR